MVVEFKKGHNNSRHFDEMKLDENEARDFVRVFLRPEIDRHMAAIKMCKRQAMVWDDNIVVRTAYESSVKGHLEDIAATEQTIESLKKKWGWTNGEGK